MKRKPRILVAEDDEFFRKVLFDILEEHYTVTLVASGRELYTLLCGTRDLYDAVVTDIVMPDWDGDEGIRMAEVFGAELPTVFISGHPKPEDAPTGENRVFLAKPFRPTQILETLSTLLQA